MSGLRFVRRSVASAAFALQLLAPALARAACGDSVLDDAEQCDDGNVTPGDGCDDDCTLACTAIGPAATEHTCMHGEFGPFVTVTGQAYPGTVFTNVNATHTYFTVQLPGTPPENRSAVNYLPNVSGAFGMYLKERYPIVVRDAQGAAVPVLFEHAVSTCSAPDSLTWVQVLENLEEGETYTIDIGPLTASSVSFAIEYLPAFTTWLYPDEDADGVGAAVDPIAVTWCAFPESLSRFGEDCDDHDPASYPAALTSPAAPETCDGHDNDCDGEVDNASSPCTSATGGASSSGTGGRSPSGKGGASPSSTGGASPSGTGGAPPEATGGSAGAEPSDTAGAAGSASPDEGSGGTSIGAGGFTGAGATSTGESEAGSSFGGEAGSVGKSNEADGGEPAQDSTSAGEAGSSAGGSASGGRTDSRGGRGGAQPSDTVTENDAAEDAGCGCRIAPRRTKHAYLAGLAVVGLAVARRRSTRRQASVRRV